MAKTAGIVVIGNELLSGKVQDANATYLLHELRLLGVDVKKVSVIPDEVEIIAWRWRPSHGSSRWFSPPGA